MDKRKSILLIGNYPPPFGGVPRHLEDLVPHLVSSGWDVHVLSGGGAPVAGTEGFTVHRTASGRLAGLLRLPALLAQAGQRRRLACLRVLRLVPGRQALGYASRAALGAELVLRHRIAVISAYNLIGGGPVGGILSELFSLPLVVTNFGELYSALLSTAGLARLVAWICARASRLTSMTEHCAASYRRLGLSPTVEVIPFGIDLKRFSPERDAAPVRERFGLQPQDQVVLFVGRMIEDMGLHTLLAATPELLQGCESAKVMIVGNAGHLTPRAVELAGQYPGRVHVVPDVPLQALPAYYAAATLLVAPTQGDRACGSLAAAEAMATAKPVVATRVGGIPEFVDDGQTGLLIPPEDGQALVQAVLRLLADPCLVRALGQRARQVAEARHDRDRTNRRYERLFSEIGGG